MKKLLAKSNIIQRKIQNIPEQDYLSDSEKLMKLASTKLYVYAIACVINLTLISFFIYVSSLSDEDIKGILYLIDSLSYQNLRVSPEFISDIALPNPISVLIVSINSLSIIFAIYDLWKSKGISEGNKIKEAYYIAYASHLLILLFLLLSLFIAYNPKPKFKVNTIEFITQQPKPPPKIEPPKDTNKKSARKSIDSGKPKKAPPKPVDKPNKAQKPKQLKKRGAPKPSPRPSPKPSTKPISTPKSPKPLAPRTTKKPSSSPAPKAPAPKLSPTPAPDIPTNNLQAPKLPSPKPRPNPRSSNSGSASSSNNDFGRIGIPGPRNYTNSSSANGSSSSYTPSGPIGASDIVAADGQGGDDLINRLGQAGVPDNIHFSYGNGGGPGNPARNNYNDRPPSTASQAAPDLGPYMSRLQNIIKKKWKPPSDQESKKIVVSFTIASDGTITNIQIVKTNASQSANQAALGAIRASSPLPDLPPGSPPEISIEFTFDYNVFKRSRY